VTRDAANAQPEPRRASRYSARRRRRLTASALVLILLLACGGYVAAVAATPLPGLTAVLEVEAEVQIDADAAGAEAAVASQTLPTAIGWADGEEVWSNDDTAYPLASVSKLITVLVCMEAQPLEPGADGPIYTWTEADRQRQDEYLAMAGVAYPIPVGTEITLREMLKFIFLPSSNDYAAAYAYWVFGDNDAFLAAVEEWKERHGGLESISFVEPTGMDDLNRANAADLVRVARIALQNPTVREFNGMQSAEMPWGIGLIENTNPLLGEVPGVIGVKTGALDAVGYNFVLAQEADAFGREIINISVTLARPTKEARADSGREMLALMASLPQEVGYVAEGERVGSITTWSGEEVELVTAGAAGGVLLPGEAARRTIELGPVGAGSAGSPAGQVLVGAPVEVAPVGVVTSAAIEEPDLWWKLTHPGVVLGGENPSPLTAREENRHA